MKPGKSLPIAFILLLAALLVLFSRLSPASDPGTVSLPSQSGAVIQQANLPSVSAAKPAVSMAAARTETPVKEEGAYTTAAEVALYLHLYNKLPDNFMTKGQARQLGWSGGDLQIYAPMKCIGGDHFGNYEGMLPDKPGRDYYECDIDTLGKSSRGAKRLVYSNDGLIYYTEDHYESFKLLYGEE
jgi:guanyl-specific ribonuclease Sa